MKAYLLTARERCRVRSGLQLLMLALLCAVLLFNSPHALAQKQQRKQTTAVTSTKSLTIHTEANAIVWLDEVRRGVTNADGQLKLEKIAAGSHTLRVRASGFTEKTVALAPTASGQVNVKLIRTTDEAELFFQQAEAAREKASDDASRHAAVELYSRALLKRPRFPAAHLGLARLLLDLKDSLAAYDEIDKAREGRPVYPEATVVEGRLLRASDDNKAAIETFRRAVREAHGFQPEAHTGLALALEDAGRNDEAVTEFRKALAQLSDTEPIIYQLLGALYEKMEKYKEAVEAYENYLRLAPEGNLAPAIRSIIDQLRRQSTEQLLPG